MNISIEHFLDGGTTVFNFVKGYKNLNSLAIDDRIKSKTSGNLYWGYPNKENTNYILTLEASGLKEHLEMLNLFIANCGELRDKISKILLEEKRIDELGA